ncbi:hypothetical protein TNIN_253161 [Trichonephila inaurata madagascariensis]|uniref:EKC/KEOPS complex subunit CGI121 n=2 Tax=Trichonephila inaurata madagascariensis TaxID=2747483 RepID=A0A8X6XP88_9ARAC|nr:hypothetical protein TNIN_253161 [Trichonephila inaurata madagascariensis]
MEEEPKRLKKTEMTPDPEIELSTPNVTFLFFESIENMKEIKDSLLKGKLQAAVVNPELIYHSDQLLVASHKSLYNHKNNLLKTKTPYTELLYNLFPSKSIRDSLKTFGAQDEGTAAIFVLFSEKNELSEDIKKSVKGSLVSVDKIVDHRNLKSIKKIYKISEDINDEETILNLILSKMACKEFLL